MRCARCDQGALAAWCVAVAAALLVLSLAGCRTAVPVADRTLAAEPHTWVAFVPRDVRAAPQFARLVDARKRQYTVEVVEYDPSAGTPEQRLALVHSSLERVGAGVDGVAGYALLIGGPSTLPMGPWQFDGVETALLTDFPLGAGLDTAVQPVPAAAWHAALNRPPRWIVGRIPFDDAATAVRMLGSAAEQMPGASMDRGVALLGAGGTLSSWALASVRTELRTQAWSADLVGPGGSCDAPAPGGILPDWDRRAPHLVVMAAHTESPECGGGLGSLLPGASARTPNKRTPPALMIVFAGCFGAPDNEVLRSLFEDGWAAGGVAFTAPIGASPLGPAWRLAEHLPTGLALGAPLGNAAEASRRRYWTDASRDWGIIMPGARQWQAQNALSMTVYGDPALRAAGSLSPPPTKSALPLVVSPDTDGRAPAANAAGGVDSSGAPGPNSAWAKWLGLAALLVFLFTVLYWMLLRRK